MKNVVNFFLFTKNNLDSSLRMIFLFWRTKQNRRDHRTENNVEERRNIF